MKQLLLALSMFALVACGSQTPAPIAPTGPGQLDPKIAEAIATFNGVEKIEMYVDKDGSITKISVYHHDAARVPEEAKKVASAQFPGGTIKAFEYELYRGEGYVHEIEFETADKKECEASVGSDGKLRYTECVIDKAPDAIAKQIEQYVPGGTIAEVEEKKLPSGSEISVEVKVGAVEHYLRFSPSGELLSRSLRVVTRLDIAR